MESGSADLSSDIDGRELTTSYSLSGAYQGSSPYVMYHSKYSQAAADAYSHWVP